MRYACRRAHRPATATRPASRSCGPAVIALPGLQPQPWSATGHDVIMTQGAQQAPSLLGRAVLRPGDVVAMEDPGYPPARRSFYGGGRPGSAGARGRGRHRGQRPARGRTHRLCHAFAPVSAGHAERRNAGWTARLGAAARRAGSWRTTTTANSASRAGRWTRSRVSTTTVPSPMWASPSRPAFPGAAHRLRDSARLAGAGAAPGQLQTGAIGHSCTSPERALAVCRRLLRQASAAHARNTRRGARCCCAGLDNELSPWLASLPTAAGIHSGAEIRHEGKPGRGRVHRPSGSGVESASTASAACSRGGRPARGY